MSGPRLVPPAPHVMAGLYADYLRVGKPNGLTFHQYLAAVGYSNPAAHRDGMDDAARAAPTAGGPMRVSVPAVPVTGPLRIIVLLVDFPDRPGTRPAREYEDLLFSSNSYPTGSMRDYYREVSGGRVDVTGTVHGWFRLPQRLRYYANGESGLGDTYPRNAQRMALDAVRAAVRAGVTFDPALDALGDGTVTGLFVVHAGRGAEVLRQPEAGRTIWSHKWTLPTALRLGPALAATTYLTVPFDCLLGVCAHELGHLAFQWEDYYDPNGNEDGQLWDGSGSWDLMASGSYNGAGGTRPAHPMGLHKAQHGWARVQTVSATQRVVIPPYTPAGGTVVRVDGPAYTGSQFLLLENRRRTGFDDNLPGEGLLVWRVDLARDQNGPARPAVQLVQADGRMDLEMGADLNQGDAGDPFPGATRRTAVPDTGAVSTSFPGGPRSGVTLSNVAVDPATADVAVTITIGAPAPPVPAVPRAAILSPELAAALERLKLQPTVRPSELAPLVRAVTPTRLDLERAVLAAHTGCGPATRATTAAARALALGTDTGNGFDSWWFQQYKATFGVAWEAQGTFEGNFSIGANLTPRDDGRYLYRPDPGAPLRFVRSSGEVIQPGVMVTDGGSVPSVLQVLPDIDQFTYIKAYLIHDWDFLRHHCDGTYGRTFAEVNATLAEGIYTLMRTGEVATYWWNVEVVYQGVSSPIGRAVWGWPWRSSTCAIALPGGNPPGTT